MRTRKLRLVRLGTILLSAAVALSLAPPANADPTRFTDREDDAYRYPDTPAGQPEPKPPNPLWSNDAVDVVAAEYATAPPQNPGDQAAYRVSVTVPGQPHASYNYIVGAQFGDDCWIFHYLTAGETRRALTQCGSSSAGTIPGSRVTINGDTIAAVFSFRRFLLPSQLKRNPELGPLFVLTCPATAKSWACNDDHLDFAYSESTFRI